MRPARILVLPHKANAVALVVAIEPLAVQAPRNLDVVRQGLRTSKAAQCQGEDGSGVISIPQMDGSYN